MKKRLYFQVCSACGSKEVARCKWVNVNDDTIYDQDSGTTLEWCMECEDETSIIEENEFKESFLEEIPGNESKPSCENCGSPNIEWHHYDKKSGEHFIKCYKCNHIFDASLR